MSRFFEELISGIMPTCNNNSPKENYAESNLPSLNEFPDKIQEDILDLFSYYVDNICDEKIKDLNVQVKFYGFIACVITISFICSYLLLFSVWIISLNEDSFSKTKSRKESFRIMDIISDSDGDGEISLGDNYDDSFFWNFNLEHSFTADFTGNKQELENERIKNLENIQTQKWELPKKVTEKALFWKNKQSSMQNEYSGYESIIDIYSNEILDNEIMSNNDKTTSNNSNSFQNGSLSFTDLHFKRVRDFSETDILSGNSEIYNLSKHPVSRAYSQSSIQKIPVSKAYSINETEDYESEVDTSDLDFNLEIYSSSHSKIVNDEHISLLLENDSEDFYNTSSCSSPKEKAVSIRASKSEDNIIASNNKRSSSDENSKEETMIMSKFGPTYLYIYMNIVYGSWNEFKSRSFLTDGNSNNKTGMKNIFRCLKYLNRRQIRDFKWPKITDKLKTIRGAFIIKKYHDVILKRIIKNVDFLANILIHEDIENRVKLEIYYLFFYSFSYESEIQINFQFLNLTIKAMIKSLSLIEYETNEANETIERNKENIERNKENSMIFSDGIRCLYSILGYSTIEDFINKIFEENFEKINELSFKEQNITWELLKLVICEWMLEAETAEKVNKIYYKLNPKFENLIANYVEKDNSKFQEFLIIWRMLISTVNVTASDNNENNINEIKSNKIAKKLGNGDTLQRKLSIRNLRNVNNIV